MPHRHPEPVLVHPNTGPSVGDGGRAPAFGQIQPIGQLSPCGVRRQWFAHGSIVAGHDPSCGCCDFFSGGLEPSAPGCRVHDHSELEPILVATAAMVDHDYGSAIAEVEAEGYEVRIAFRAWVETAMWTWRLRAGGPNWVCAVLCGTPARRGFGHGRSF